MNPRALLAFLALPLLSLAAPAPTSAEPTSELSTLLADRLPRLGHRNWIVVADSAYPSQVAPGVETVVVKSDTVAAVAAVLRALDQTRHVRPVIHLDSELTHVPEADAAGITDYRARLDQLIGSRPVSRLPHESIIGRLDEAGRTFHVLLIKTPLALPYTSVFFELECGYWSGDAEKRLRAAIAKAP